jgi:hypothetical protein
MKEKISFTPVFSNSEYLLFLLQKRITIPKAVFDSFKGLTNDQQSRIITEIEKLIQEKETDIEIFLRLKELVAGSVQLAFLGSGDSDINYQPKILGPDKDAEKNATQYSEATMAQGEAIEQKIKDTTQIKKPN